MFQLVLDPRRIKYITDSGYTTSMKHETLKISFGNQTPANWFSIYLNTLKAHLRPGAPLLLSP